jgi:general secretion pathway protein A
MYNEYFGLKQAPFDLTPNPESLYLSPQYKDALAALAYVILGRKGIVVLTGDAGTGKTTVLRRMLEHLSAERVQNSLIVHPTLTPSEFLEATLLDFGLEPIPTSKAQRIAVLRKFLWKTHAEGKIATLIVDEAHKLSPEVLEEVRLLGNFEAPDKKLLQIVLVGQNELDGLLDGEGMRQFNQRIALRLTFGPLLPEEIPEYIQYRWRKAGGADVPFTSDALSGIARASQGIPRLINALCDNSLLRAFGQESATVDARHVAEACRSRRIPAPVPETKALARVAAPVPIAMDVFPMRTLQRYAAPRKRSLLARLAGMFRLTQRIETA